MAACTGRDQIFFRSSEAPWQQQKRPFQLTTKPRGGTDVKWDFSAYTHPMHALVPSANADASLVCVGHTPLKIFLPAGEYNTHAEFVAMPCLLLVCGHCMSLVVPAVTCYICCHFSLTPPSAYNLTVKLSGFCHFSGTMTLTTAHQYGAGLCFRAESGKLDAATTRFCKLVQEAGFKLPSNPKKYVQEWGPRLGDDGTIESHAQESGRISTLAVEAVLTCHTEALGWWRAGMDQPYGSIQELVETNPVVKSIITQAGVTKDTLLRHMKDVFPNFQFKKLYPKRKLTAAGMADRVSACQQNQQVSDRDLELVVWFKRHTASTANTAMAGLTQMRRTTMSLQHHAVTGRKP
jgi:hypothetical protein